MTLVNIKDHRINKCAFCRHWYDPRNEALIPKSPAAGFWAFDPQRRAQCTLKNMTTAGCQSCSRFEEKML